MADVIPFPSCARPRLVHKRDALPAGVDFRAVVEAFGPARDGQPTGFAVVAIERERNGSVVSYELMRFYGDQQDEAEAFAAKANATWGDHDPRGAA